MLEVDVVEHQALLVELGNALMARELWAKALNCFACINECDDVSLGSWRKTARLERDKVADYQIDDNPDIILSMAVCQHMMEDYAPALEAMRWGELA